MNNIHSTNWYLIFIFTLVSLWPVGFFCQSENKELIKLVETLSKTENDTMRADLLNKISWHYTPVDQEKSKLFADSALKISEKLGLQFSKAQALNNLGEIEGFKGNVQISIRYHTEALDIFTILNDSLEVANTLTKIGRTYFNISDYKNAIENLENALKLYQAAGNNFGVAKSLNHIGIIFSQFKEFDKALEYMKRANSIFEEIGDSNRAAIQLGNIGIIFGDMGDYKGALPYYLKALNIFKSNNDLYNYSLFLGNAGLAHMELGDYDEAEKYFFRAYDYAEETNDIYGVAHLHGNLGKLYLRKAKNEAGLREEQPRKKVLDNSVKYLNKAIDLFMDLGLKEEEKNILFELYDVYLEKNDFKTALTKYVSARKIQDSIHTAENNKMIAELELQQDLDIQKKELQLLNSEKEYQSRLNSVFIIFILVILGSLISIIVLYINKRKQNKVLEQNIIIRKEVEDTLRLSREELENYKNQLEILVEARTKALQLEINERKRTEYELIASKEKAESASKAKSVLLANMSHELRTPLVGILGYSGMMSSEIKDPDFKEMADGINRTGVRLLNTLSMILDLARVESDRFEIKLEDVDVFQVIKEIHTDFLGAVALKKVKFNLQLHTESFIARTDKEMLRVIMDNLINNAIKFTSEGEITIRSEEDQSGKEKYLIIKVIDSGIGINKEDIPLIFEEFRQLSQGTTKDYPGTGLGLSITKKYMELLNGKILVESEHGKGTTFILKLNLNHKPN